MKKNNLNKFNLTKCSCDFSLILLIFLFVSYPEHMTKFSHSFLGRLIAILLILFYSTIDIFYGFFFCIIVIYYYQLDYNENSLNTKEGFFWELTEESGKSSLFEKDVVNTSNYSNFAPENIYQSDGNNFNKDSLSNIKPIESILPTETIEQNKFRKEYCNNGILELDNTKINTEMAQHVFNELEFNNTVCNPCDLRCKFSIKNKIRVEEELTKPKNSNEWFDIIKTNISRSLMK